jgi:hypothetical protein
VRNQDGRSQVSPQVSLSSHCHEHLCVGTACVPLNKQQSKILHRLFVCPSQPLHTRRRVWAAALPVWQALQCTTQRPFAHPSCEDKSAPPDARPFTAPQRCRLQLSGQAQIHTFPVKRLVITLAFDVAIMRPCMRGRFVAIPYSLRLDSLGRAFSFSFMLDSAGGVLTRKNSCLLRRGAVSSSHSLSRHAHPRSLCVSTLKRDRASALLACIPWLITLPPSS